MNGPKMARAPQTAYDACPALGIQGPCRQPASSAALIRRSGWRQPNCQTVAQTCGSTTQAKAFPGFDHAPVCGTMVQYTHHLLFPHQPGPPVSNYEPRRPCFPGGRTANILDRKTDKERRRLSRLTDHQHAVSWAAAYFDPDTSRQIRLGASWRETRESRFTHKGSHSLASGFDLLLASAIHPSIG